MAPCSDRTLPIRRYLPDSCDRCGARRAALLSILYGLIGGALCGFNRDFYHAVCCVTGNDPAWICRRCYRQGGRYPPWDAPERADPATR